MNIVSLFLALLMSFHRTATANRFDGRDLADCMERPGDDPSSHQSFPASSTLVASCATPCVYTSHEPIQACSNIGDMM